MTLPVENECFVSNMTCLSKGENIKTSAEDTTAKGSQLCLFKRLSTLLHDLKSAAQSSKRSGRMTLLTDDVRKGIRPKTTSVTSAWLSPPE